MRVRVSARVRVRVARTCVTDAWVNEWLDAHVHAGSVSTIITITITSPRVDYTGSYGLVSGSNMYQYINLNRGEGRFTTTFSLSFFFFFDVFFSASG